MVSCCNRRLYKGNSYEICLPLVDSGVTLVRFYTKGDVIIEKEPEISGDSMCFSFTVEELASLEDGVLRYEIVTDQETKDTNSPYVVVTPGDYSGSTLDDLLEDAFDSGLTACSGGSCEGIWEDGYDSGYTDAWQPAYDSGYTDGVNSVECSGETINNQPWKTIDLKQKSKTDTSKFVLDYNEKNGYYYHTAPGVETAVTYDSGYTGLLRAGALFGLIPTEAINLGYNSGFTDGLNVCSGGSCEEAYESGFTAGYESGLTDCSGGTDQDLIANLQGDYYVIPEGTTRIRSYAFYQAAYFTGVTIPSSVTSIGVEAFRSNALLTAFTIPDTVTQVLTGAFSYNSNLVSVHIGSGLTTLSDRLFNYCSSLSSITIPANITTIEKEVFYGCSGLQEMTFESLVPPELRRTSGNSASLGSTNYTFPIYVPCESVEDYKTAFGQYYAPRITCNSGVTPTSASSISITVPQGLEPGDTGSTTVTVTPTGATTDLTYTSSDNSVATIDSAGTITAVGTGTTDICVVDSVSQISACTTVTISNPEPVPPTGTSLLTNIYRTDDVNPGFAPSSAVQLCNESFYSAITEMTIDGVSVTPSMTADFSSDAGRGGLRYHTVEYTINTPIVPELSFKSITHLVHTVISGDCTGIGVEAFWLCENLGCDWAQGYSGVVLSPNIVLSESVFGYCTSLKGFEIPTANTVVPEALLYVCSGLTSVTIHSGVTVISGNSFQQCYNLVSIELPAGLTEIGGSAFINCRALTEIRLLATVPPTIHGDAVFTDTNNCPIYVPAGSVTAYQTAWSQYASRIQAIQ